MLGLSVFINLFLWLTIHKDRLFLLSNPYIVIIFCVLSVVCAIVALYLILRKKKDVYTVLFLVIGTFLIVYSNGIFFQQRRNVRGFSEYAAKRIEREYHLTDALYLGGGMPADVYFAADDDGSVDLTEIRNYYGHRYVCAIQGIVGAGENEGKKVLAIYEYRTLDPLPKTTVLELDPSYDTLIFAREQGYANVNEENDAFQYYPIVSVIKEP